MSANTGPDADVTYSVHKDSDIPKDGKPRSLEDVRHCFQNFIPGSLLSKIAQGNNTTGLDALMDILRKNENGETTSTIHNIGSTSTEKANFYGSIHFTVAPKTKMLTARVQIITQEGPASKELVKCSKKLVKDIPRHVFNLHRNTFVRVNGSFQFPEPQYSEESKQAVLDYTATVTVTDTSDGA